MMASTAEPTRPRHLRTAALVFVAFAFAYFFSALLRAVTATLAPVFSQELALGAGALGLLAGAYFLGFAFMQLPLGAALDRWGPKRVLLGTMTLAVVGCAAFSVSHGLTQLLLARLLIGVGVSACLMAPLTFYRHRFDAVLQLRMNSWMLMTGSLGMLSSTVPVQWLLPLLGWRGLFMLLSALLFLACLVVLVLVPSDRGLTRAEGATRAEASPASSAGGYREVFSHPAFMRLAPLAFFAYGGMVAMQSLWIGPWLTQVAGRTPDQAAQGLFIVNASMLLAFFCWGLVMPRLTRLGWTAERMIGATWPLGVLWLAAVLALGADAGPGAWAAWCVLTSVVSLSQPAVAQALPAGLAGRALSAYNLVIFVGVFVLQWGIGATIDTLLRWGLTPLMAYRVAFGAMLAGCLLSFLWLRTGGSDLCRAVAADAPRR